MATDTPLRLYNTLTREKAVFRPIDPANVRMYVCGPTVYDFAHIGNARPVIVFDVLYRLLRHLYGPEHVTYVRNITDVDDKINARAARDFPGLPLNEAIRRVTEKTAAQFEKDAAALGCLEPTVEPRATDNIEGMQTLIATLLQNGHAYFAEAAGEVLFDVGSMPDYGKLSRRPLEENIAGARVAVDAHKKNPADFVLWKRSSAEEPGWESPWGRGRPGWHIECSAMSERYLGATFDIHGGGLDLIFPHHENEIAQSRCAHGTPVMANVWMHNGFLQVEGQKMSKSLGNFVTIHDLLETEKFGGRKWPGEVLRLAMLMTHYRKPIDFSVRRLIEAEAQLRHWIDAWVSSKETGLEVVDREVLPPTELVQALADDLNTPYAVVMLNDLSSRPGRRERNWRLKLRAGLMLLGIDPTALAFERAAENLTSRLRDRAVERDVFKEKLLDVLRRGVPEEVAELRAVAAENSDPEIAEIFLEALTEKWIELRLAAIADKNFKEADAIRADLLAQGIQLMDYKDPETGERRTKWEVKR